MARIHLPIFVLLFATLSSFEAAAKYTVCTATINSKEEREVFKSKLNPADFDFVELTDFTSDAKNKNDDWFQKACEAGIKCDVLVVSGHFGGEFFGSSGFNLGLNDLNKFSCYNRCDGIMSHPKEVYLFGCNTLATKDKDHRDERTYLEVLVRDGIDRMEAERRVAARYGPFGSSFKDQIERSFENVPMIYGFKSVGPAGAHVKGSLTNYLNQVGDFKKHLDSVNYATTDNPAWQQTMKSYPIAVGKGLNRNNRVYQIKENSCRFTDDQQPVADRLELATSLLASDPYIYLPTISHFVKEKLGGRSYISSQDREQIGKVLARISSRGDLRDLVMKTARSESVTPSIRVDILSTAKLLKWMSESEFVEEMRQVFDPLIKEPTIQNADLACSLIEDDSNNANFLRMEYLLNLKFDDVGHFRLLNCSAIRDARLTRLALEGGARNRNKWREVIVKFYVLNSLYEGRGFAQEILQFARSFRGYRGQYEKEFREFLNKFEIAKTEGREQVAAVTKASEKAEISQMEDVLEALIQNERPELASYVAFFDRLLKFSAKNLDEKFYLGWKSKLPDLAGLEEFLASRWSTMPFGFRLKLSEALMDKPRIHLKALRLKLIEDLLVGVTSQGMHQASYITKALGGSDLDPDEILKLREGLEAMDRMKRYFSSEIRYILYHQAVRGRTEMTTEIKEGSRSYYTCTLTGNLRSCGMNNE